MRRQQTPDPPKPTIWLIAEDQTGFLIIQAIIQALEIDANVRLRGQAKNISTLAGELEDLLETLFDPDNRAFRSGDCVVVLHDTDDSVQTNRTHYDKIRRTCAMDKYKNRVTHLEATQECEAWLLADEKLCRWLGTTAKNADHVAKPSEKFATLLNEKHKLKWITLNKQKVLEHMDASGRKHSPSMRAAMNVLLTLPCTTPRSIKH